ncbi:Immediate early response 3-interacting protein 1 [Spatholobus suberectus]|nr:Immediate early response 3-interacting protein 1 [Spatholobus suberectus]
MLVYVFSFLLPFCVFSDSTVHVDCATTIYRLVLTPPLAASMIIGLFELMEKVIGRNFWFCSSSYMISYDVCGCYLPQSILWNNVFKTGLVIGLIGHQTGSQFDRSNRLIQSSFQKEMGLWTLLEGFLLLANALAILNEDRFLAPRGWGVTDFSAGQKKSFKGQLIGLIYATQYLRFPLILLNSIFIIVKLISG